jgi:hypothetical protein
MEQPPGKAKGVINHKGIIFLFLFKVFSLNLILNLNHLTRFVDEVIIYPFPISSPA